METAKLDGAVVRHQLSWGSSKRSRSPNISRRVSLPDGLSDSDVHTVWVMNLYETFRVQVIRNPSLKFKVSRKYSTPPVSAWPIATERSRVMCLSF
jgi:hypothetical protein